MTKQCTCKDMNGYVCHYCRWSCNDDEIEKAQIKRRNPGLDDDTIAKILVERERKRGWGYVQSSI